MKTFFICIGVCLIPLYSQAYTQYKGTIGFEHVSYLIDRENHSINEQESLLVDFELTKDNERNFKLYAHPRFQIDFKDFSRNRYEPYELYLKLYSLHFEFGFGQQIIHWGVSNSYNPTNILNRKDFEGNFLNPEELGEIMFTATGMVDQFGPFSDLVFKAIFLPLFRETPLPNSDTRFAIQGVARGVPFVLLDQQETPNYPKALGGAMSLSTRISHFDLSILYYHGLEKDPGYVLRIASSGALQAEAFYYLVDMIGVNLEVPVHNIVFHLEAAARLTSSNDAKPHDINFEDNNAIPKNTFQYVPGLEWTLYSFIGKGDLVVLAEYLGEIERESSLRNFRPFKNDLFFGLRYEFNNSKQTRIETGVIKDLSDKETALVFEASSNLYKELKLSVGGIIIRQGNKLYSPLSFFDNNTQVGAKLSYSFGGRKM